ncbi:hypothetical protein K788_0009083 [Paraburkholderia caribensis MBA4]|uniref:Uncharacterized protein n=1 Tax=Paraburkholderia caribensis MBA4 TaxID=1323664 RepID=A0A0P0R4T9_9BURK|nr:hypothetical protein K788_0009083 [Paraburkholderia caribensis MBA4]
MLLVFALCFCGSSVGVCVFGFCAGIRDLFCLLHASPFVCLPFARASAIC